MLTKRARVPTVAVAGAARIAVLAAAVARAAGRLLLRVAAPFAHGPATDLFPKRRTLLGSARVHSKKNILR